MEVFIFINNLILRKEIDSFILLLPSDYYL